MKKQHLIYAGFACALVFAFVGGQLSAAHTEQERAVAVGLAQLDQIQADIDQKFARVSARYKDAGAP